MFGGGSAKGTKVSDVVGYNMRSSDNHSEKP
jgi:hypothetical protein